MGDDLQGNRHPPGLKYMVIELFCHAAGGPEMVTSKGFDEAKLGIDPNQWTEFVLLVAEAATVWPTKYHRDMVLKLCEHTKAELCFGMEGQENVSPAGLPMALGTSPVHPGPNFIAFEMASKCPFSGKSGGQCPFSGQATGQAPANKTSLKEGQGVSTLQGCLS